jgi:hypothetical protein
MCYKNNMDSWAFLFWKEAILVLVTKVYLRIMEHCMNIFSENVAVYKEFDIVHKLRIPWVF